MKEEYADLFWNIGRAATPSPLIKEGLHTFMCHLCGFQDCSDDNNLRYQIFKAGKYIEEAMLPPNQNSLDQHICHEKYLCYIWQHAPQLRP